MGKYRRIRTGRYLFNTRATPFFTRLPVGRIQRAMALEAIKRGRLRPWAHTKEQVLGCAAAVQFEYNPRPVRMIGTVMDSYGHETSMKGGLKILARQEETNVMMWVPLANPKLKAEVTPTHNAFSHFLDERDRWDEAWLTGRARVK